MRLWIVYPGNGFAPPQEASPMPRLVDFQGHPLVQMPADICSSPEKQIAARRLLLQAGCKSARLLVDLSLVPFPQASLLGLLAAAFSRLGARPGDVVVCAPETFQHEVFRVVGLDKLFTLCATPDEAIRAEWPDPKPLIR